MCREKMFFWEKITIRQEKTNREKMDALAAKGSLLCARIRNYLHKPGPRAVFRAVGPMNEDTIAYTAIKPRLRPGRHGALPAGMPPDSSDSTPAHKATPASPCSILALELDAPGTTSSLSGDACVAAVDASPRGPDFVSERLQRAKSSNMLRRISESGDDMSRRVTADAGGTTRRQEHEQNLPQLAV